MIKDNLLADINSRAGNRYKMKDIEYIEARYNVPISWGNIFFIEKKLNEEYTTPDKERNINLLFRYLLNNWDKLTTDDWDSIKNDVDRWAKLYDSFSFGEKLKRKKSKYLTKEGCFIFRRSCGGRISSKSCKNLISKLRERV